MKKLLLVFFVLYTSHAYAAEMKTSHFHFEYHSVDDLHRVYEEIALYSDISSVSSAEEQTLEQKISLILDVIYSDVSEILGISGVNNLVKVVATSDADFLSAKLQSLYGKADLRHDAFYSVEEKTFYINTSSLRLGVFAHELAHAIIDAYFPVPLSENMQEVLAGYVEYKINKKIRNK